MENKLSDSGCGCSNESNTDGRVTSIPEGIMASMPEPSTGTSADEPCCGPPPEPASSPMEKPGYTINRFVKSFKQTPAGPVPQVKNWLNINDYLGTVMMRANIRRDTYKVAPGIYCTGTPGKNDPILVTANYKLSFDQLRSRLSGINAWILVLDTRGINVWCAAGKGTFGTDELVKKIKDTGLEKLVSHRRVILPQLGATGVSAQAVKKETGFKVVWGPIHVRDLTRFIKNDFKAEPAMREVTFTLTERIVLIPVELSAVVKQAWIAFLILLALSGIGSGIFSLAAAWNRGCAAMAVLIAGVIAGAAVTPALLPKIPGTSFSVKGSLAGLILTLPAALFFAFDYGPSGVAALVLAATAISSFLAMNFTGATPFTSPSGVEKEMRKYIPIQAGSLLAGAVLWIVSGF